MNTDSQDAKYRELTEKIIGVFNKVYNQLGYGFLESVKIRVLILDTLYKEGGNDSQTNCFPGSRIVVCNVHYSEF